MGNAYKPKHQTLQEFTKILFEHNPMQISMRDNPGAADEYESEALSILSRYTEGALHLCEDESLQREIAVGIVRQAFEFWFNDTKIHEPEKLGFVLLEVFKSSFPTPEQVPEVEVPLKA